MYGPYRRANCHIDALIRNAARDIETELPDDPAFVYHYVYVDDVADALVALLETPRLSGREYNVGSGQALTMPEIVQVVASVLPGMHAKLVPGSDDVPDRQTQFDISAIAEDHAWRPRHDLRSGMDIYRAVLNSK